jgi:phage terminase large subunit
MQAIEKVGSEVKINIFPKQEEFISGECDDVLYGGAAGGGKSYAVMLGALRRRLEYPGTHGIIFRRTFPELEKSIIKETRKLYPIFGAKFNETKHYWTFPNGSVQEFGFCEKDGDVYKHLSAEYHDEWFDEATTFTEFQIRYLTSRCRSSIPGVKPIVRLTSNPGGVSHSFIYSRYIKPAQMSKVWKDPNTGKSMSFIPARISDNPALEENDPDYIHRLKELPEKKYLALAEGRWDVFEGAYFENFDPRPGHGVLANLRKPDSYTIKFLSMDWGYSDPACVLWGEITPMGRIFIYRELYTTKRSPKELALDILGMCPQEEEYLYLSAPPEIWGKRIETEGGGEPIQRLMESVLKDRIIMKKANNARIPGWMKVREYLYLAPDGYPWLQISPNCVNLIRTIPNMVHDDRKKEDINLQCEDHAVDALRYLIVSLNEVPKHIITPYESNYDRIFKINRNKPSDDQIPMPAGRGGY